MGLFLTKIAAIIEPVTQWVETVSQAGLDAGRSLTPWEAAVARHVGVQEPGLVRLIHVDTMPMPASAELQAAAQQLGLLSSATRGLTLDHAIFIRGEVLSPQVLAHELRHVHQYEQFGSIEAFLSAYLRELLTHGYAAAPLECDARQWEDTWLDV